jgi:hypothetical protein
MSAPPAPAPVLSTEETSPSVADANTPEQPIEPAAPHQLEQEIAADDDSALSAGVYDLFRGFDIEPWLTWAATHRRHPLLPVS